MNGFLKFKQNGCLTLISVMVYIMVATLVGEYIISREVHSYIQILSIMIMLYYTVWQIRYVVKFLIKIFNI
jgi:hypothetical protein